MHRPVLFLLLLWLTVLASPAVARTLRLRGVQVVVDAGGAFRLRIAGRDLVGTAAGVAPTARQFSEEVRGGAGQWTFARADETSAAFGRLRSVRKRRDAVVLKLRGERAPFVQRRATITLRPIPDEELTRIEFAVRPGRDAAPASLALPIACDPGATFHGFGEQYNATDQRGEAFRLFVSEQGIGRLPGGNPIPLNGGPHTTYFPMPYWLDARGFGVLVETEHRVEVDLCRTDPAIAWVEVVAGDPLRLVVFHGPGTLDVIRQLGAHVGRPKAPPPWAYGLWIGAQGGREAVLAEAAALRAADVPARVLWVQDWTGPRVNLDGGLGVQYRWEADAAHYPDLAGLVATLRAQGFRFLAYVNPFVDPSLQHFAPMAAQGLLIRKPDGSPYTHFAPNAPTLSASHPDLTDPAAREYVKAAFRAIVDTYGIDGWMADFGEWVPLDARYDAAVDPVAFHDRYPVEWHRLSREALDAARPDGDYVVFARSGWTGVQAVSMIHWAGDQETDWSPTDGLPTVVPALLNLGLSGVPFVTHDIAGFSGFVAPPSTKDLYLRWTELGAFTPIMRTHEGADRVNNWSWEKDAETTAHFRRFARVHEALGPELRALAAEAAATSAPIVRHLMLVFPDDVASRAVSDQFMLGTSLLVAPVVAEGAVTRAVYLPPAAWYDVWTGTRYDGPATVVVDAPLGRPPVFARGQDRSDLRAIE